MEALLNVLRDFVKNADEPIEMKEFNKEAATKLGLTDAVVRKRWKTLRDELDEFELPLEEHLRVVWATRSQPSRGLIRRATRIGTWTFSRNGTKFESFILNSGQRLFGKSEDSAAAKKSPRKPKSRQKKPKAVENQRKEPVKAVDPVAMEEESEEPLDQQGCEELVDEEPEEILELEHENELALLEEEPKESLKPVGLKDEGKKQKEFVEEQPEALGEVDEEMEEPEKSVEPVVMKKPVEEEVEASENKEALKPKEDKEQALMEEVFMMEEVLREPEESEGQQESEKPVVMEQQGTEPKQQEDSDEPEKLQEVSIAPEEDWELEALVLGEGCLPGNPKLRVGFVEEVVTTNTTAYWNHTDGDAIAEQDKEFSTPALLPGSASPSTTPSLIAPLACTVSPSSSSSTSPPAVPAVAAAVVHHINAKKSLKRKMTDHGDDKQYNPANQNFPPSTEMLKRKRTKVTCYCEK